MRINKLLFLFLLTFIKMSFSQQCGSISNTELYTSAVYNTVGFDSLSVFEKSNMSLSLSSGLVEIFSAGVHFKINENFISGVKYGVEFLGGERGATFLGIVVLPTLGLKMDYNFNEFLLCPDPKIRINTVGIEIKRIGLIKTNSYRDFSGNSF